MLQASKVSLTSTLRKIESYPLRLFLRLTYTSHTHTHTHTHTLSLSLCVRVCECVYLYSHALSEEGVAYLHMYLSSFQLWCIHLRMIENKIGVQPIITYIGGRLLLVTIQVFHRFIDVLFISLVLSLLLSCPVPLASSLGFSQCRVSRYSWAPNKCCSVHSFGFFIPPKMQPDSAFCRSSPTSP